MIAYLFHIKREVGYCLETTNKYDNKVSFDFYIFISFLNKRSFNNFVVYIVLSLLRRLYSVVAAY